MKRSIILSVATAIALAGGMISSVSLAAAEPTQTDRVPVTASAIAWTPCSGDPSVDCGQLAVPLDYARPNGRKISLAVTRVRHTVPDSKYQGIMLVNPGGPGGSGTGLATLGQYVPNGAGDFYDWIGFDPRGVGDSQPSISCDPHYFDYNRPFYIPFRQPDLNAWLARSQGYAAACAKNDKIGLLQHMTTVEAAKDMDSIRQALGQRQINFYGFSYGTYLGQVYATMFPEKVRRMVFDGNVDPTRVFYQANLDQDIAFERNMNIWFGWLAQYDSVYHLGKTQAAVKTLFYAIAARLAIHPAGGKIGYDEWIDTFLSAGYYQLVWLDDADVLANFVNNGDVDGLIAAYGDAVGIGDDNGYAVYNAVQCTDAPWPQQWSTWSRDNWRTFAQAPYETWSNAWYNAPCLYWPAPAHQAVNVGSRSIPPILLVSETLDAATPYTGSLQVRQLFPNSRLLALPGGTTHAGSLFGDACEDDLIANYLATGALPARKAGNGADATCAPLPVPDPTAAAAAQAKTASKTARAALRVAMR